MGKGIYNKIFDGTHVMLESVHNFELDYANFLAPDPEFHHLLDEYHFSREVIRTSNVGMLFTTKDGFKPYKNVIDKHLMWLDSFGLLLTKYGHNYAKLTMRSNAILTDQQAPKNCPREFGKMTGNLSFGFQWQSDH